MEKKYIFPSLFYYIISIINIEFEFLLKKKKGPFNIKFTD